MRAVFVCMKSHSHRKFFLGGGNYIRSSTKYSQLKIFSKCEHLFRKVELFFFNTGISFSQGIFLLADCEVLACAHESWELVPLDELCVVGQRAEGIRGLQS